jgi:hypothetical protein
VPLRVRAAADATEEPGAIELRRDSGVWRVAAAQTPLDIPVNSRHVALVCPSGPP